MIPLVAASERGGAQTPLAAQPAGDASGGLDEWAGGGGSRLAARAPLSRRPLERVTAGGESPVGDRGGWAVGPDREYRRTRDIRREAGATTPQGYIPPTTDSAPVP